MNTQTIPAGLLDNNIELFAKDHELYALNDGVVKEYESSIISRLHVQKDMQKNIGLVAKLKEEKGISGIELEKKWADCRYSGFDNTPDIDTTTGIMEPEYHPCPERVTCKCSGLVCHIPANLTPRELETLKALASGEPGKTACSMAGIKYNTYKAYLKSIYRKTGTNNMAGVIGFAKNNNII